MSTFLTWRKTRKHNLLSSIRMCLKEKESMSVWHLQRILISLKYMSLFQTVVSLQQPIKGSIYPESLTLMQCNVVAMLGVHQQARRNNNNLMLSVKVQSGNVAQTKVHSGSDAPTALCLLSSFFLYLQSIPTMTQSTSAHFSPFKTLQACAKTLSKPKPSHRGPFLQHQSHYLYWLFCRDTDAKPSEMANQCNIVNVTLKQRLTSLCIHRLGSGFLRTSCSARAGRKKKHWVRGSQKCYVCVWSS